MRIDILTLFPEMCESVLGESIIGRARKEGFVEINCRQIRDYSTDKHKRVDDTPYGGGVGMVMTCQPIYDCYRSVISDIPEENKKCVIYMSPKGRVLTQRIAEELSHYDSLVLLCGHYEGIDERVLEEIVTDYVSIGDYVLTGGELPAMVMIDAISRLIPGVLHNDASAEFESFQDNLLEYPHYSRPETWHDKKVPPVLLSGHHVNIEKWRREQSVIRTAKRRPDLLKKAELTEKEKELVKKVLANDSDM